MSHLRWLVPLCLFLVFATPAQAVPPGWAQGASLTTGRDFNTATLLPDGSVLVAGGYALPLGTTASAERYFPSTNTWQPAGTMVYARRRHAAALLDSGKVLVVGGETAAGTPLGTAEVYDPATNTWAETGPLKAARTDLTATRLPNGKVLVAGGWTGSAQLNTAELFDPTK